MRSATVTPTQIPRELEGMPLPVEVLTEGSPTSLFVPLITGEATEIDAMGPFALRATLPSGKQIVVRGEPGSAIDLPIAPSKPRAQAVEKAPEPRYVDISPRFLVQPDFDDYEGMRGSSHRGMGRPGPVWVRLPPEEAPKARAPRRRLGTAGGIVGIEDGAQSSTLLFRQHRAVYGRQDRTLAGSDLPDWKPAAAWLDGWLLVLPPTPSGRRVSLVEAAEGRPPLAKYASGDAMADAVFAFVAGGTTHSALALADPLVEHASRMMMAKHADPVAAVVAAYALLRLGRIDDHPQWWDNLADAFPRLPDGAVTQGWRCIQAGDFDGARQSLIDAARRGVPIYTEGVKLLRDGLALLNGMKPDEATQQAFVRAHHLAAAAEFASVLTILRIGSGVEVRKA